MNWVDLVILGLLLFFALEGLGRSFIAEWLDFFSFLLAFFLSLRFYNLSAQIFTNNFQIPHSLANVLGFIAVWFLVETLLIIALQLILPRLHILRKINSYLTPFSVIPAILRGLIFISIILVLLGTFPIQPGIKSAVNNSIIGSQILDRTHQLEVPLKRVFGGITQDTLTFLTIKPRSDERVNLGFATANFKANPELEQQMINLVNNERTKRGLQGLRYDPSLQKVARIHSEDMFNRGYFSHFSPENKTVADRANENGVNFMVIGENLAFAPSLTLAHEGLMNSSGHRANILSPEFNKIGIGIMESRDYGLMITQVFSD